MKIGKVQGFLQGFLRACKKDFDEKISESGLWDEFIAHICNEYAENSDNEYLNNLSYRLQETNVVFYKIPVKCLKEEIKELNHANVEYIEDFEKEIEIK